jgi:hypothetical protein
LDAIRFKPQTLAAASNSSYQLQLSNVVGMISHVYFFVRAAGANGFDLNDFKAIGSFDIVDGNGNSIIQYPQESDFKTWDIRPVTTRLLVMRGWSSTLAIWLLEIMMLLRTLSSTKT